MVKINNKEFQIYELLDTEESILNRIAVKLNTFQKYIYFPNGIPKIEDFYTDGNIIVEDVFSTITNYDNINFEKLYEEVKDKIVIDNLLFDLINPFIAYNKDLENIVDNDILNILLDSIQTEINSLNLVSNLDVKNIWDSRFSIIGSFNYIIEKNKNKSDIQLKNFKKINDVQEINTTVFEVEKDENVITLDVDNMSLTELFNYIKLNEFAPFASYDRFYKILKDYIPYEEWSISGNYIILMVLPTKQIDYNKLKIESYSTVIIEENENNGIKNIVLNFYFYSSPNNLSKEEFINRIKEIILGVQRIGIKNETITSLSGIFNFPNFEINKYVFADLVMNDSLFSSLLKINEGAKATKDKKEMYVYFNHMNTGNITAIITKKIMIRKEGKLFSKGKSYIRVKIKSAKNMKAVLNFQTILSKMMRIYIEQYPNIVEIYKEFIPNFGERKEEEKEEEEEEEKEDIFPSGFTRICANKPSVIKSKEEEENAVREGKEIMIFPRDEDVEISPQQKYVCNYKDKSYPALIKTKEIGKFPYLPCCYSKDPKDVKNKLDAYKNYRKYYHITESEEEKETTQQILIKTNKFVDYKIFGEISSISNVDKMFKLIDTNDRHQYLRTGVYNTKNSFLNCILLAIGDETIQTLTKIEEIELYLSNIRKNELTLPEMVSACKQEMYDYTLIEIEEYIKDFDKYFDPKLFLHLLEVKYNCNIFLFSRTNISEGEMILPRYIQSYEKIKNDNVCIFIYEHIGSESDYAKYPRCEIIIRNNKDEPSDNIYRFENNDLIYEPVFKIYNQIQETYALQKVNKMNYFPLNYVSQKIDSYGKVRMVNVIFENKILSLITSPIQPMGVEITEEFSLVNINVALKFAKSVKMIISKQIIDKGILKEISGKIGNVSVSIPIIPTQKISKIPEFETSLNYVDSNSSYINIYNKNKKLSRYIVEYMFWLYSIFLKREGKNNMIPEEMIIFSNEFIKIDPLFEYRYIPKMFSMNSGIMHDGKLVIKSQEMLKRLLYVLRLESIRNTQKLFLYNERKNIENYYLDIMDFDQHQFQVILEGEDSVEKWINERKVNYNLFDNINFKEKEPYFYKNKLIEDNVFIAQNTDNLNKAVSIARTWYEKGYNPGYNSNEFVSDDLVRFNLYVFDGLYKVKMYSIQGNNYDKNIRIIGYKKNNKSFFTVLLSV